VPTALLLRRHSCSGTRCGFLSLLASSEMRLPRRVPITAITAITGINLKYLHAIIMGAPVSADYCERFLSPF
jgi:hypothetical protein